MYSFIRTSLEILLEIFKGHKKYFLFILLFLFLYTMVIAADNLVSWVAFQTIVGWYDHSGRSSPLQFTGKDQDSAFCSKIWESSVDTEAIP